MKIKIDIDTRTFVRFWLVVIAFAFAILMIYSARYALFLIGASLFLAIALNSPVNFMVKHLPYKNRVVGITIAYTLVVAIIGLFVFLVVPPIIDQTIKFMQTLPYLIESASGKWSVFSDLISRYELQPYLDSIIETVKNGAFSVTKDISGGVLSGIGSILTIIVSSIAVLVMSFLMLIEAPTWTKKLWNLYEDREKMEKHRRLIKKMYNVVSSYVNGQLVVALVSAASAGLVIFILSFIFPNIPKNLALPTIAATFTITLIPMFGATIAGTVISILIAFNSIPAAIIYAIFFIIYQQIEGNFVVPVIQSKQLDLSALAILISVMIGVYMFGLVGAIVAVPVAGCIKVMLDYYFENVRQKRQENTKPVNKFLKKLQGE